MFLPADPKGLRLRFYFRQSANRYSASSVSLIGGPVISMPASSATRVSASMALQRSASAAQSLG